MKNYFLLLLTLVGLFISNCKKEDAGNTPQVLSQTYKTADYDGSFAHEWEILGHTMIKENFLFAPQAARIYGYIGMTIWESVYGGIPNARNLSKQIQDYSESAAIPTDKAYDWAIVMATAMKQVFPVLVDDITPQQRSLVDQLASLHEAGRLNKGVSNQVRDNSRALGVQIGQTIAARVQRDGRDVIRNIVSSIPVRDAEHKFYWDPTTFNQKNVEPLWSTLQTFVIENAQTCETDPPFAYSINSTTEFYADAKEIYDVNKSDATNRGIAMHWENGPGRTSGPAGHWISIARQQLVAQNANLAECAKVYALTGFALADAYSVSWYHKNKYYLLTPVTYLREVIDPSWNALLNTPPYPNFTSGSATAGGAASVVLTSVLGEQAFTDKTHLGSLVFTNVGSFVLPERTFTSYTQAAREQAESRVIGGVCFRRGCMLGLESGQCVGNTILAGIDLGF
ncbi:MAG: vanadium-dependent haloperoxidase [Saprospiraceae bacterium]|nr:vanadium-dependent haloperoxidase [Saprospiraceae bacterium]